MKRPLSPAFRPDKAFILAAGFGTRLLPLTTLLPKTLLRVWGVPAIDLTIQMLTQWGVKDILINLHHAPDPLLNHFLRSITPPTSRISFSFEPDITGTGGALRHASWFFDNKPFWMINGDIVTDLSPAPLLSSFRKHNPLASLWVTSKQGPRSVIVKNNLVKSFRDGRPNNPDSATFCGLHLLSPEILSYIPNQAFSSVIEAYEHAIKDGKKITTCEIQKSFWADIGSPETYIDAHRRTLQLPVSSPLRRSLFAGTRKTNTFASQKHNFAVIPASARIGSGAVVNNSVVGEHAEILPGVHLHDAVVADGTRINRSTSGIVLPATSCDDAFMLSVIQRLSWTPAQTSCAILSRRGSDRSFVRLMHGPQSVILIRYGEERKENELYAEHCRFLSNIGVPVPDLIMDLPKDRALVIADVGDAHLRDRVLELRRGNRLSASRDIQHLYDRVIKGVVAMHSRGLPEAKRRSLPLSPAFTPSLYQWEHDLFCNLYLDKHLGLSKQGISRIQTDLKYVSLILGRQEKVLIHRDLQSTNILLFKGQPVLIDFQGMRFGPAAYDVASLLCDPYVQLSAESRKSLLSFYMDEARLPAVAFEPAFHAATIQRLAQAIGAYVRLSSLPGVSSFLQYIPPALRMMREALKQVPHPLPALKSQLDLA